MKVTVVATESVEVQVTVEDEDPGVNTRGLVMFGIAAARDRQCCVADGAFCEPTVCRKRVLYRPIYGQRILSKKKGRAYF